MTATLLDALAAATRADPGRPFVTFYDDTSGERVELSLATYTNWVSKVANLFGEELMLEPGESIGVALPTHWLSPVVAVGAWAAGLVMTDATGTLPPAVRVVGPAAMNEPSGPFSMHVVACSLRPLAGAFLEPLPDGWLDFALEVPPQPDVQVSTPIVRGDDPALTGSTFDTTHGQLVTAGEQAAREVGLHRGGRLATDANPTDPQGLLIALAAPLVSDASVVLVVNASSARRARIAEQELVSCQSWST